MSNRKDHKSMERLDKIYNMVLQSGKNGIKADDIAPRLNVHRTTVYRDLNRLYLMGKVESDLGTWRAKTGEQTIKPLEKEIVIELPLPRNEWQRMVLLENYAKTFGNKPDNVFKISLEKLKETRTIRITGKNVDNLTLEKVASLIKQANENSLRASLRGVFKNFKRAKSNSPESKMSSET